MISMQALPEFPPGEGESRPMTFRKVLLNTCQEEFEGTHEAREVMNMPLHCLHRKYSGSVCVVLLPHRVSLPSWPGCGACSSSSEDVVGMELLLSIAACTGEAPLAANS